MFNLLVGILSEELSTIIANKTISNYSLLLGSCIEYETIKGIFYYQNGLATTKDRVHLIYATEITGEDEEGQVQNVITAEIKAVENR